MTLTKELYQLLHLISFNSNLTEIVTSKGDAYKLYNCGNYACFLRGISWKKKNGVFALMVSILGGAGVSIGRTLKLAFSLTT